MPHDATSRHSLQAAVGSFSPPCLRSYQAPIVEALIAHDGPQKVVVCLATGGGKTIIAGHVALHEIANGGRVLFVVDRLTLHSQTRDVFEGSFGVRCGSMRGGDTSGLDAPCVIATAQAIARRGFPDGFPLILVDEAHIMSRRIVEAVRATYARVIGLTATPFSPGMHELYNGQFLQGPTLNGLIEMGGLVPPVFYAARSGVLKMTESDINTTGEFDAEKAGVKGALVADGVPREWLRIIDLEFGGEPQQTLAFSATIAHGEAIRDALNAALPEHPAVVVSAHDDAEWVERQLRAFAEGRIRFLISVSKLSRGFDSPVAAVGLLCRPLRKSLAEYGQSIGRLLRPNPGKDRAVVVDFTETFNRLGGQYLDFMSEGVRELPRGKRPRKGGSTTQETKECPDCGQQMHQAVRVCPGCGHEFWPVKKVGEAETMVRIDTSGSAAAVPDALKSIARNACSRIALERGESESAGAKAEIRLLCDRDWHVLNASPKQLARWLASGRPPPAAPFAGRCPSEFSRPYLDGCDLAVLNEVDARLAGAEDLRRENSAERCPGQASLEFAS